ncbi:DUF6526 family protein [Acidobacteria bacterium AH-259-D05]|nr:DUF6526 family protein [Acidobacteria bacterium AH-259-D05]
MEAQNYDNHRRFVKGYHVVLLGILVLTLLGSFVNLYQSLGDHQRQYSASLIVVMMIAMFMIAFFSRIFPLKAQDRAIRAEENLRHYVLTGKLLDPRVTTRQVIGLRFAPDEEFVDLAQKAAEENLSEDEIKKAVKNWRADNYRV